MILIDIMVVCALPFNLTAAEINNYVVCQEKKEMIEHVSEYHSLIQSHFKIEDWHWAALTIYCESSGHYNAYNENKDGSNDQGLFQFNNRTFKWLNEKFNRSYIRVNILNQFKYASWLVYNDGKHHWNASKHCWNR